MCGKKLWLCLPLLVLSSSLWSQSLPAEEPTFREKLDQALEPLRTLPAPQRKQLGIVLTIFADEFDLRAKASEATQKQLEDLQTSFSLAVKAHRDEVATVKAEALVNDLWIGGGAFLAGLLAGALIVALN